MSPCFFSLSFSDRCIEYYANCKLSIKVQKQPDYYSSRKWRWITRNPIHWNSPRPTKWRILRLCLTTCCIIRYLARPFTLVLLKAFCLPIRYAAHSATHVVLTWNFRSPYDRLLLTVWSLLQCHWLVHHFVWRIRVSCPFAFYHISVVKNFITCMEIRKVSRLSYALDLHFF